MNFGILGFLFSLFRMFCPKRTVQGVAPRFGTNGGRRRFVYLILLWCAFDCCEIVGKRVTRILNYTFYLVLNWKLLSILPISVLSSD